MRCDCCDVILSTLECKLKNKNTGVYLNTCLKCLKHIPEIKIQYPKDQVENDVEDIDVDSNDMFNPSFDEDWDSR